MRPLRTRTIVLQDTGDTVATSVTTAPSAAAIGWVPFYPDLGDMPTNAYTQHPLTSGSPNRPFLPSAFSVLFESGNVSRIGDQSNPNPLNFSDQGDFLKMLATKNFRAALSVDEVKVWRNRESLPLKVSLSFLGRVGYTPLRQQWGSGTYLEYFSGGKGSTDLPQERTANQLSLNAGSDSKLVRSLTSDVLS